MASRAASLKQEDTECAEMAEIANEYAQDTINADNADKDLESQIAILAYQLWERRGRTSGSELEDWFNAEREIKGRAQHTPGVAAS